MLVTAADKFAELEDRIIRTIDLVKTTRKQKESAERELTFADQCLTCFSTNTIENRLASWNIGQVCGDAFEPTNRALLRELLGLVGDHVREIHFDPLTRFAPDWAAKKE